MELDILGEFVTLSSEVPLDVSRTNGTNPVKATIVKIAIVNLYFFF